MQIHTFGKRSLNNFHTELVTLMSIKYARPYAVEEDTLFFLTPWFPPFSNSDKWYKRNHLELPNKKGL